MLTKDALALAVVYVLNLFEKYPAVEDVHFYLVLLGREENPAYTPSNKHETRLIMKRLEALKLVKVVDKRLGKYAVTEAGYMLLASKGVDAAKTAFKHINKFLVSRKNYTL